MSQGSGARKTREERQAESRARKAGRALREALGCPLVLVGMPGAGKSKIGMFLAQCLDIPFIDTDQEIERAAGCSVAEIFTRDGESAFRIAEARLVTRLAGQGPCVIATGGGAVMNPQVWDEVLEKCLAIWVRADLDLLVRRTEGRPERPLLASGDVRVKLQDLLDRREPVYARAPLRVESRDAPPVETVSTLLEKLAEHLSCPV